jgi:hypothetical protein
MLSLYGTEAARKAVHNLCAVHAGGDTERYQRLLCAFARLELSLYKVVVVDDFEADGVHAAQMMGAINPKDAVAVRVVKKAFQKGGKEQAAGEMVSKLFSETFFHNKVEYCAVSTGDEPEFVDCTDDTVRAILSDLGVGSEPKPVMVFLSTPLYELQDRFFRCLRERVDDVFDVKVVVYAGAFNVAGLVRTIDQLASTSELVSSVHVFNRFAFDVQGSATADGKSYAFPSNLDGLGLLLKSDAFDGPHLRQVRDLNAAFVAEKAARGSEWVRGCDLVQNLYQKNQRESDDDYSRRIDRATECWSALDAYISEQAGVCPANCTAEERADWGTKSIHAMRGFFFGPNPGHAASFLLDGGYVSARRQNMINGHPVIADQLLLAGPMVSSRMVAYRSGKPAVVRKAGRVVGLNIEPADDTYNGAPFYLLGHTIVHGGPACSTEGVDDTHLEIARGLFALGDPTQFAPTADDIAQLTAA